MHNQKGQSLVEVVIALGIAVIIVIAFTNATIASVRNSQFSKNQNLATKFAQETLELVRAIRDQNSVGNVTDGTGSVNSWGDLWGINLKNAASPGGGYTGYCFTLNKSTLSMAKRASCSDNNGSGTIYDENIDGIFYRKINITDDGTTLGKKQVSVRVYWSDNRGQHNTDVTTYLTNWQ